MLVERVKRSTVVKLLNLWKDPSRIIKIRNPEREPPRFLYRQVRNDDSLVFEHELWRMDLGDTLADGSYAFDSRSALLVLGLANVDITGLRGTQALDRLKELVALIEAAEDSE
jgi:hypothetical protein